MPNKRYDKLVGGIGIGPCREFSKPEELIFGYSYNDSYYSTGTLGAILLDNNYEPYIITNYHIVCVDDKWDSKPQNTYVTQPSVLDSLSLFVDCSPENPDYIGDIVRGYNQGKFTGTNIGVDCAIVKLKGARSNPNNYMFGWVLGANDQPVQIGGVYTGNLADLAGQKVWKYGATTGYTEGFIQTAEGNVDLGDKTLHNQLKIKANPPAYPRFSNPGDSGAIVLLASTNQVVGLLHSGTKVSDNVQSNFATPVSLLLNNVFPEFNFRFV